MRKTIFGFALFHNQPYKTCWVEDTNDGRQLVIETGDSSFKISSGDLVEERAKYVKVIEDIDKALELITNG